MCYNAMRIGKPVWKHQQAQKRVLHKRRKRVTLNSAVNPRVAEAEGKKRRLINKAGNAENTNDKKMEKYVYDLNTR